MGKAWKFGNDIDTDVIIPARYLNRFEPEHLAAHCMEDADASFAANVKPGDIMLGGKNFGCGSSREHAPLAIKAAGVKAIIAESYARIFYRNALNIGMPILECPEAVKGIESGDEIEVDLQNSTIRNVSKGTSFQATPFPPFMQELIKAGGLVPYVKEKRKNA
ncbi:3-isopropylmalate dehydratase small subunit [Dehalobacter sp. UNSWDHB]|jgi:3-isopropylmalate dehydratase, small subunit|uniref:3-isopropylmalate dehydratase small subunit n=1 Tax=unclassified Dehalobacter TaxID=2635733 RepID=UPI00028B56FB|nr:MULTISPECIES: 3-isopropylmalate dehydratase small subunit [unclassified Dehalobacter]AFV01928.1 3-isopropylmalate dehydratase small subunit [Dehalobacter sp. DCA]AFV04963.1 3-isopropylmalate dehydratase small subunit [Dehalobacter sp. CF]EQB22085.1 3-isopropylmalate dehydratase small subunit [Dehalobacter sp. UNSWDHB]